MGSDTYVTHDELREVMEEQLKTFSQVVAHHTEESRRHMEVLVERVESRIDLIAEGHQLQVAKLDRLTETVDTHTHQLEGLGTAVVALRGEVSELRSDVNELRGDMTREFKELRAHINLSYSEIDGRLRFLEQEVVDLRTRLDRLEARQSA